MVAFVGWAGGAVFLGSAQHNRRAYLAELEQRARDLEESREEEARRRVAEERLRIARDLHDVIAHGIATIHMQSGAALHVLDRHPEQAAPALAAVKQLSKQTMQELRATLDVLRSDDAEAAPLAPTPGLDRLERARRRHPARRAARRAGDRRGAGRAAAGRRRRRGVPDRAGVPHQRDASRRRAGAGHGHRVPRRRRRRDRRRRRRPRRRRRGAGERRARDRRDARAGGDRRRDPRRRRQPRRRLPGPRPLCRTTGRP